MKPWRRTICTLASFPSSYFHTSWLYHGCISYYFGWLYSRAWILQLVLWKENVTKIDSSSLYSRCVFLLESISLLAHSAYEIIILSRHYHAVKPPTRKDAVRSRGFGPSYFTLQHVTDNTRITLSRCYSILKSFLSASLISKSVLSSRLDWCAFWTPCKSWPEEVIFKCFWGISMNYSTNLTSVVTAPKKSLKYGGSWSKKLGLKKSNRSEKASFESNPR